MKAAKPVKGRGGFTLVELVIVLTIIVILGGVGIYSLIGLVDDARVQAAESDVKTIGIALESYARNNNGRPPAQEQGLRALVEKPDNPPKRWRAYLEDEEALLDPWGNEYQYRLPAEKSKRRYDIYSFGEDGVQSDDDIGNW